MTVFNPKLSFEIAGAALSVFVITIALVRYAACVKALLRKDLPAPEPDIWPTYTVLVPVRDEAHMVSGLMKGLAKLDYPVTRFEILMISEANDPETTRAVLANLRPPFKSVVVPTSLPATKPKALNVAMQIAKGDIITIYDAEDRPHPAQLKAAASALMKNPKLAAVQAPLSYYNANQNWLTRQFTLEYDSLFEVWNPMMTSLGLPFPLGGTSNHIKRQALDSAGLWDPHNVTEDADLSFRLSAFGWKIGTIGFPTGEEALSDRRNWNRQRSRWQKGFLQSWIVHMRKLRGYGWRRAISLQLTVGATLLAGFLHVPTIVIMLALAIGGSAGWLKLEMPGYFFLVMGFGYSAAISCAAIALYKTRRLHLWPSLIWMPLYWLWHFWPSLWAAAEMLYAPYRWQKTEHGRAKFDRPEDEIQP